MLRRFLILWCVLHIIILLVEIIRYQLSDTALKFEYYLMDRLLGVTYCVWVVDMIACILFVGYICINYITKGVLL